MTYIFTSEQPTPKDDTLTNCRLFKAIALLLSLPLPGSEDLAQGR